MKRAKRCSVVSLFAGCGGLDVGFRDLGFDLVYACDNDPSAIDCYARNIDKRAYIRDVTSVAFHADIRELGGCDVVLGGFPCQGFSKAGPKRKDDVRNALYVEMLRAVEALRPKVFIAENVDGISQNFGGAFLDQVTRDFGQVGYAVAHRILDAASFGLPQFRRRVFFVGVRKGARPFSWPTATHAAHTRNGDFKVRDSFPLVDGDDATRLKPLTSIGDAIGDLLELDPTSPDHRVTNKWPKKYRAVFAAIGQGQKLCNVRHAATSVYTWHIPEVFGEVASQQQLILEAIAKHRRHKKYGFIPNGNPIPIEDIEQLTGLRDISPDVDDLVQKGYLKAKLGGFDLKGAMFCSGLFKRPRWNEPCPTLLTNFHNPRYFLHPLRDRPFSLRECARLQGFDDNFLITSERVSLVDGYRLIGNAVSPVVSRKLAECAAQVVSLRTDKVA
ncbi:MAG: hypothetical protein DCC68_05225 [Planctomycetota bacterium]|nr:MAG: hypothetical protein DCC68_05225 [Planctomycetota bacterium]